VSLDPEAKVDPNAVVPQLNVIAVLFCRQYWLAGCDTAQNGDTLSAQIAIFLSSQQVRFTDPQRPSQLGQYAHGHVFDLIGFVPIIGRPVLAYCLSQILGRQVALLAEPLNPF